MESQDQTYYLYPSKIYVSASPVDILTILGSCIAVCLWDSNKKIGGMNHFMLPLWNGQELASPKYGNIAIDRLLSKMIEMGADRKNIVAKVFGGSEILQVNNSVFQIGKRNIEIAKKILQDEKIRIINESTGSKLARRILFRVSTGEVIMKFVSKPELQYM